MQVASLERRLHHWLSPQGAVPHALDTSGPSLEELPYTLGSHCADCKAAPHCWADAVTRGSLQLAGCRPPQVAALQAAGVNDLRQLAANEDQGPQQVPGIAPHELSALRLVASVRQQAAAAAAAAAADQEPPSTFTPALSPQQRAQGRKQLQGGGMAPDFALLPGASRTSLPPHWYEHVHARSGEVQLRPLTRVYLSVAWEPVLGRVAGLAAHVADAP